MRIKNCPSFFVDVSIPYSEDAPMMEDSLEDGNDVGESYINSSITISQEEIQSIDSI